MRRVAPYVLAGLGIGSFIGMSTGVAAGGDAANGIFVFGPIGALIGWLFARGRTLQTSAVEVAVPISPSVDFEVSKKPGESSLATKSLEAVFVLFASLWNAHIYLLEVCQVLPTFVQKPWLFFVLAIVVSIPFPPFLGVYLFAYLGAAHFGISEKTDYRANIT